MRYYAVEQLGESQSFTPEGFLLCVNTPIGRLGMQVYAPHELADDQGRPVIEPVDGVIRIDRIAEEVFSDQSMASGRGKSVVDNHPQDDSGNLIDVLPENWKALTVGVVLDIRRGEGLEDDVLLADLLITDEVAIGLVRKGKRQLSIGYNCDYYETGAGRGEQRNIVINHLALVEQGRCGPRCSIGDSAPGETRMAPKNTWLRNLLLRAHVARDAAEVEKLANEAPPAEMAAASGGGSGGETHLHIHTKGNPETESRDFNDRPRLPDMGENLNGRREGGREDEGRDRGRRPSLRDRLRDSGFRRRGRDDDEGGGAEGESGARDRFEALEQQHEEMAIRLEDIEDMLVDLLGGGDGEEEEAAPAETEDRMRGRDRGRGGYRDARSEFGSRLRDRMRGDSGRRRGRDDDEEDPDPAPQRMAPEDRNDRPDPDQDREIEGQLEEEAPAGTGDRARRARDSAYLADSFSETCSLAEIIAPGIRLPTFDLRRAPVRTYDDICGLRKAALVEAYRTSDGREAIDGFLGRGRTFDAKTVRCETARNLFLHVGALRKRGNARDGGPTLLPGSSIPVGGKVKTIDDLQAIYDDFYSKKGE